MTGSATPRRPPSGAQLRADRTRSLVIDETVRCVREEGFAAASAKHIAERAGVTWGVIQYHFGDRNGLLTAVVDKAFDELLEILHQLSGEPSTMTIQERTEQIVTATWRAFSSPCSMAALEILIGTRTLRDAAGTQYLIDLGASFDRLGARIADGLDSPDSSVIGKLVMEALRGLMVAQLVNPAPIDTTSARADFVDLVSAYLAGRGQE